MDRTPMKTSLKLAFLAALLSSVFLLVPGCGGSSEGGVSEETDATWETRTSGDESEEEASAEESAAQPSTQPSTDSYNGTSASEGSQQKRGRKG